MRDFISSYEQILGNCRCGRWKLLWDLVNNKKDPKVPEMQNCARHQWITQEAKTNSLSSFSSSGSKLNSTLVQYKKETLHQNSLLCHTNCNILSVERNKLEKSTFEFPSVAKSQTLGKLALRCVLKLTSSYRFLPFNASQ